MLVIEDNPWGIIGLESGATSLESELAQGTWLVFVYSPNNIAHKSLAFKSWEIAQQLDGMCRIAIRPTDGFADLDGWIGDKDVASKPWVADSPLWLLYRDGKLIDHLGRQTPPQAVVDHFLPLIDGRAGKSMGS